MDSESACLFYARIFFCTLFTFAFGGQSVGAWIQDKKSVAENAIAKKFEKANKKKSGDS